MVVANMTTKVNMQATYASNKHPDPNNDEQQICSAAKNYEGVGMEAEQKGDRMGRRTEKASFGSSNNHQFLNPFLNLI